MNTATLIFDIQFVESTLMPKIKRLAKAEELKCLQLSTNSAGANREVRIRCRCRLTIRDLILLWEIKEVLPSLTRLFIEDLYEKRVSRIVPRCLTWEDFRDRLYVSYKDDPWKVGRVQKRLTYLLSQIRVCLVEPPQSKKTHRLRTPSAAGGSGKTLFRPPLQSNKTTWEETQHVEYLENTGRELEHATRLLAAERAGESLAELEQQTKVWELPAPKESVEENEFLRPTETRSLDCAALLENPGLLIELQLERVEELCKWCPGFHKERCVRYRSNGH